MENIENKEQNKKKWGEMYRMQNKYRPEQNKIMDGLCMACNKYVFFNNVWVEN